MNPLVPRVAILITELVVFFMVTALMTYFISFASAPEFAAGAVPPAAFPGLRHPGQRHPPPPFIFGDIKNNQAPNAVPYHRYFYLNFV